MKTRHLLQILLLSAVWGISYLMIAIAGTGFPPVWVGWLRASSGALLLWTVLKLGGYKLPPRGLWLPLLLVAFFNNALPFVCFAWGEQTVPSNTAAVLNATTPIWTLLLTLIFQKVRAGIATIAGVLIGFTGVAIVVFSHNSDSASTNGSSAFGIIVISIGALAYAIATTIAKARLKGLDPIGLATTQLTLASLMLAPVALFGPHPTAFHLAPFLAILVLGFAGSGVAYLLYYSLLAHISATHVVAVTYLLPIWGLFWGYIAHETISPIAFAGVAVVILGLVLMNLRVQPASARLPQPQEGCR